MLLNRIRPNLVFCRPAAHSSNNLTTPALGPVAFDVELDNAKRIADIAIRDISKGKYTAVLVLFDTKAAAEEHIRTSPIKSAFMYPGSFMENLQAQTFLTPR
ncbi:hypothetical protein N7504_000081 [Penicillium tannophilum]|nr:hypothetical protein N7504_000081 [Penicillium tannophilum]